MGGGSTGLCDKGDKKLRKALLPTTCSQGQGLLLEMACAILSMRP